MSIFDFGLRKLINYVQLKTTHDLPTKEPEIITSDNSDSNTPKISVIEATTQKLDINGLFHYYDNWSDPDLVLPFRKSFYKEKRSGKMLPFKGLPYPVDIKKRTHLCVHITAVEFGTMKSKRDYWKKIGRSNLKLVVKLMDLRSAEDINEQVMEKFGEKMALFERYWEVPYHWVSLVNGDIIYNNDITRYTYHGDGSNSFSIGCSVEGNLPGLEKNRKSSHTKATEKFITNGRAMLINAVMHARSLGAPLENITAHRCFDDARQADPGEIVWREIVLPVAQAQGLHIDYTYKKDDGMPICREWDHKALFDYNGKLIK